jgi:hypothetical protein
MTKAYVNDALSELPLVNASALVDQVFGGGGLTGVDVANDDEIMCIHLERVWLRWVEQFDTRMIFRSIGNSGKRCSAFPTTRNG